MSLAFYKCALKIAQDLGWPQGLPYTCGQADWQISPNDSSMSANISVNGDRVLATLIMNYAGRNVTMVRIVFDGHSFRSEGLLFKNSLNEAKACFKSHLENMLFKPNYSNLRAA